MYLIYELNQQQISSAVKCRKIHPDVSGSSVILSAHAVRLEIFPNEVMKLHGKSDGRQIWDQNVRQIYLRVVWQYIDNC